MEWSGPVRVFNSAGLEKHSEAAQVLKWPAALTVTRREHTLAVCLVC